jgi:hypothetical protein
VTATARHGYDRAIDLLEALVPIARRLEQVVRWFGVAVIVAALVITVAAVSVDVPGTVWTWGLVAVLLGLLLIAPVFILVFSGMLREALTLPGQLRSLPEVAPARARELADLTRLARAPREHEAPRSIAKDSWRAGRLLNAVRREVPSVSVLLAVARWPFIIAVFVAALIGIGELFAAPLAVFIAVVLMLT